MNLVMADVMGDVAAMRVLTRHSFAVSERAEAETGEVPGNGKCASDDQMRALSSPLFGGRRVWPDLWARHDLQLPESRRAPRRTLQRRT
jgi:hypothetical protein